MDLQVEEIKIESAQNNNEQVKKRLMDEMSKVKEADQDLSRKTNINLKL